MRQPLGIAFAVFGAALLYWRERARKRIEQEAQRLDQATWARAERELNLVRTAFLLLFIGLYGLAFYLRFEDPSQREPYVLLAMLFGVLTGNLAWQSWTYMKLVRALQPEYHRLARRMALVNAVMNLILIGFIYVQPFQL